MSTPLNGQVALVTGAASGIGRAVTDRLVRDGAIVVAGDIDAGGLASLADTYGDRVVTARCDVTDEADVEALANLAVEHGGLHMASPTPARAPSARSSTTRSTSGRRSSTSASPGSSSP